MNKSESIKELASALAQAQAEMKNAPKAAENPFYKSKYADLSSVWDTARGPITKHGLSVVQIAGSTPEGKPTLETVLMHSSGEWISGELVMKPVREKKGEGFVAAEDPQAIGSAISYARRYGLAAICGVATEDDDGNAASVGKEKTHAASVKQELPPAGDVVPPDPTSASFLDSEDQEVLRDHLHKLCKEIGDIEGAEHQSILHSLTVNKEGKYGKTKYSDVLMTAKGPKGDWSPLKAVISKAEDMLAKVSKRGPGSDDDVPF